MTLVVGTARIASRSGTPVQRIVLTMPPEFRFRAGQYLEVLHPEGAIPLSIASAPHRLPELHLHYRSTPGAAEATRMDALLASGDPLQFRGPAGDVGLDVPLAAPALLVAGGTGIAQAASFVDEFAVRDPGAPVTLLWCADREQDFYLADELRARALPWLELVTIADPERTPRNHAMVWLREHGAAFAGGQVVLAGGPPFVYAACDALAEAGVPDERLQSDVFSYAPRPR